jgi:DnaK suppressor protein
MTNIELEGYRGQLRVRQNRNIDGAHLTVKALAALSGKTSVSLPPVPIHTLDLATHTFERQFMEEVTAALERIDKGTFGCCGECGKTIPVGRLEVLPYTRYCVECAWKLQKGPPKNGASFREADGPSVSAKTRSGPEVSG